MGLSFTAIVILCVGPRRPQGWDECQARCYGERIRQAHIRGALRRRWADAPWDYLERPDALGSRPAREVVEDFLLPQDASTRIRVMCVVLISQRPPTFS
jgi:hypothetical protein